MSPLTDDAEDRTADEDAANVDPRIDYEPPEGQSPADGGGDGADQGG